MPDNSLISIIMPTYNRAGTIGRAIDSIIAQAYENFELIIIDDNSEDDTEEVINSYNDKRITFIKCEKNEGQTKVRNIGLKKAKGKYIAFLDSDDEWDKGYLERQLSILSGLSDEYGVVYCKFRRLNKAKESYLPKEPVAEDDVKDELMKENFTTLQAFMLKKQCLDKCGYLDEAMDALEDWEFFIRLAGICKFKYNNEILVTLYASENGANDNILNRIKAREHILVKYNDYYTDNMGILAHHYYILAMEYAFIGDKENTVKSIEKAAKLNTDYKFSLLLARSSLSLFVIYLKSKIKLENIFNAK